MNRITLCLLTLLFATGLGFAQTTAPTTVPSVEQSARVGKVAIIPIEGAINDYTFTKLERRIEQAKADGVDTLIIKLNTPGGAVGATLQITRLLKKESERFHIVAYIDEMAYSAGTMIAVACQEIVMSSGSTIGDVAPILPTQGGLAELGGANRAKIESPLVAEFEDSAERNGYDPLLLRAFVQYQVTVYVVEKDGQRRFVEPEVKDQLLKEGWRLATDIKNPIDDELTLLTVNNRVAEQLGLSKGTYATVDDFIASRDWTLTHNYETTGGEMVIDMLSHDTLRGLLSVVFMLSIYLAINKPGTGIFEVLLVVSGMLLIGVPLMTGYATWLEILLIILGVSLLAVEIFLIPGFGVAGFTGILLILAGLVMTFVPSEGPALPEGPSFMPQLPQTRDGIKEGLLIVSVSMLVALGLWLWLSRFLPRMPYFNRLILQTTVGSTPEAGVDATREAVESTWPHVGAKGVAATDLRPGGIGRFYDTIINDQRNIDVICDHGFVASGDAIVVRQKRGTEIVVRKV